MRDEGDDVKKGDAEAKPVAERVGFGSAPVGTVEHWAAKKGMLLAVHPGRELRPQAQDVPGQRAVRVSFAETGRFAPRHNPAHVGYAAARALYRWPIGAEMTEAEFDEAVAKAYGPKSDIICR
jgi:hypothetical protein